MTLETVKTAIQALRAEGRLVSQNAVIAHVGGSKRDVGPLLRQALQELDTPSPPPVLAALDAARQRLLLATQRWQAAQGVLDDDGQRLGGLDPQDPVCAQLRDEVLAAAQDYQARWREVCRAKQVDALVRRMRWRLAQHAAIKQPSAPRP